MFGKRIRLFKLLNFQVWVDLSWIVIAVLIAWSLSTGYFPFQYRNFSARTYWLMGGLGTVSLFVSIIIHELSHSIVARKYGIPVKGIMLFVFSGVAEMDEELKNATSEFMMAIMGPVSSIASGCVMASTFWECGQDGLIR